MQIHVEPRAQALAAIANYAAVRARLWGCKAHVRSIPAAVEELPPAAPVWPWAGPLEEVEGQPKEAEAEPVEVRYFAAEILAAVCVVRKIDKTDLLSPRRTPKTVTIRHEAYWLVKKLTKLSLPQIGRILERDHATILHGVRKHQAKIDAGLVDTLGDIKPAIDAARAAKIEAEAHP